jgi:hypothetical protein
MWDDSGSGPDPVLAVALPSLPTPVSPPPPSPRIPGTRAARIGAWVCAHPQVGFAKDLGLWTEWSPVGPSQTRGCMLAGRPPPPPPPPPFVHMEFVCTLYSAVHPNLRGWIG